MDGNTKLVKRNKTITAAGAACLPVAAMFVAFGIVLVVGLVQMLTAPQADYGIYFILYFFDGVFTTALTVFSISFSIVFYACAVVYILMSVALFRQGQNGLTKAVLIVSVIISALICLISLYPFITGIARVIVHGPQNELAYFLVLGLLPLSLSTASIVLSAVAMKKGGKNKLA